VEGSVAFVGVNVIPMTEGASLLRAQTVIVRGGRIAAIGRESSTPVPRGAARIDARDRYLLPGLVDAHVHLEYFDDPAVLSRFLASGVTTVRNMDGRPYILAWKRRVALGTLLGPTIYTAGPILDGDPPLLDDNTVVRTAADARAAVEAQHAAGYDFVKVYTNISREAYDEVIRAARARGLTVAGHVSRHVGFDSALASGQHTIEHLAELDDAIEADDSPTRGRFHWSKLFLAMPADSARMRAVAKRLAAAGTWVVPTSVQPDRALPPSDSLGPWLAFAEMMQVPAAMRDGWAERARQAARRMDAEDWRLVERGRVNRRHMLAVLREARVNLAVGTDTPNPFVVPGASIHEELANFIRAGFSPLDAIAAATREPAQLLGASDEFGTVEVGKRADLMLVDANPLSDLAALRHPLGVMVRGRWLPIGR
jgi:imidazolonepropionase-like amidohydrolase